MIFEFLATEDDVEKEKEKAYKIHLSRVNRAAYLKHRPFPIRLGELKPKMQEEAFQKGSTIHKIAVEILKNYYNKKEVVQDAQLQKLIELVQLRKHNMKHITCIRKYGAGWNSVQQLKIAL